jgi:hypothetical protein
MADGEFSSYQYILPGKHTTQKYSKLLFLVVYSKITSLKHAICYVASIHTPLGLYSMLGSSELPTSIPPPCIHSLYRETADSSANEL